MPGGNIRNRLGDLLDMVPDSLPGASRDEQGGVSPEVRRLRLHEERELFHQVGKDGIDVFVFCQDFPCPLNIEPGEGLQKAGEHVADAPRHLLDPGEAAHRPCDTRSCHL